MRYRKPLLRTWVYPGYGQTFGCWAVSTAYLQVPQDTFTCPSPAQLSQKIKPPTRLRRTRGTKEGPVPWVQPLMQQKCNPDVYSSKFLTFTITKNNSKDLGQTKNTMNIKLWRKHCKSYQPLNASLNRCWCSPAAVPTPTGICWRCHQATPHTNSPALERKISWPCDQVQKEGGPDSQSKAD